MKVAGTSLSESSKLNHAKWNFLQFGEKKLRLNKFSVVITNVSLRYPKKHSIPLISKCINKEVSTFICAKSKINIKSQF